MAKLCRIRLLRRNLGATAFTLWPGWTTPLGLLPGALLLLGLSAVLTPVAPLSAQHLLELEDQPLAPGDSVVYRPVVLDNTAHPPTGNNTAYFFRITFATGEPDSVVRWRSFSGPPDFDTANFQLPASATELNLSTEDRLYIRQDSLGLQQVGYTRAAVADSFFENSVYVAQPLAQAPLARRFAQYPLRLNAAWTDTLRQEFEYRLSVPFFMQSDSSATRVRQLLTQDSIVALGVLYPVDTFYIGLLQRTETVVSDSLFQEGQPADNLLLEALDWPLPTNQHRVRYQFRSGHSAMPIAIWEGEILPTGQEVIRKLWVDVSIIPPFAPTNRADPLPASAWSAGPNPLRSGQAVQLSLPATAHTSSGNPRFLLTDLSGRQIPLAAPTPLAATDQHRRFRQSLPPTLAPGVYLLADQAGRLQARRLVVLPR